ncbi:MAG: TonB-dependent receptor [Acidobacteria bacterium]|nr:TonB-dependent receptor [Acidobacteriota bacterium]
MKVSKGISGSTTLIFELVVLLSLASLWTPAQVLNTTVSGAVKDQAGAVIPGAKVILFDSATKLSVATTTNTEGFYLFNDVRSGYYLVQVEATGFKKAEVRDVKVDVSTPATINVTLETGQIAEVITTTATDAQAVINTENAELTTVVLERQINDLPLNGRNPVQLAGLQVGVATNSGTRNSTINGMRGSYNNLTWDGINIQETYLRGNSSSGLFAQAAPSVVAVGEFSITTQNSGASDGTGVAQVKLVTPRGSTALRGQLFEFHRNDVLDANSFFNNLTDLPKEKLIQNQFGFGIGGPIKLPKKIFGPLGFDSNKLFFYAYDEETRAPSQLAVTRTVLAEAARQGNFTYRRVDNGQLQTVNLLNLTGRPFDSRTQRLIGMSPLPNDITLAGDRVNTGGFRFNTPSGSSERLWGFRIDYNHSERHRFEAIYSNDAVDTPNDAATNNIGEPFPGLPGAGQFPRRQRAAFAWNWVPAATLTNEVRGGFYRQRSLFLNNAEFPEGNLLTFPSIGTTVTNPVRNTQASGRNGRVWEFTDNASWVRGSHLIRFGGNFRSTEVEPFSFAGVIPTYTLGFGSGSNPLIATSTAQFPGGIGTNDFNNASNLLALLTGAVTTGAQTFNVTSATSGYVNGAEQRRNLKYEAFGGYGADTWRIRQNLTLNFGLRYEYFRPVRELNGIGLIPRGGLEALYDPNLVLDLAGGAKGTQPFYKPDRNNFAPNFSFSWDPFKSGKTAIRGGYAISYVIDSVIQTAENAAIDNNAGLSSAVTVRDLTGTVSGGGLVPINRPEFKVPRTLKDQQTINLNPTVFTLDPNLTTPYVQQWNLGIEREILPDTVLEVRYVGNHGVKLVRGIDINQVTIFRNGFLQDFLRAQQNLSTSQTERQRQMAAGVPTGQLVIISPAFNAVVPGSQQLSIFPQIGRRGLFTTATGTTLDSAIVNLILQGQAGELANLYTTSRNIYLTPGTNGAVLTPGFFLRANPEAGNVDYIGNGSFSNYNALQAEVRRRLKNGIYWQANYSWSKGYTDFDGSDSNFSAILDLDKGTALEKKRIANDLTHIFKVNGIYELPLGPGKRFLNQSGVVGKLLGGWSINGIFEARTGRPISIIAGTGSATAGGRGTVNRLGRSARNTANTSLSIDDLKGMTGLFRDPTSGLPILFDPKLIGPDGRANPQFFQNPAAGNYGLLHLTPVSGPGIWNVDLGLIKRTQIRETVNLEFRAEAFNAFNHTNFFINGESQDINNTTFGRITQTFDPRILQFGLKLNF